MESKQYAPGRELDAAVAERMGKEVNAHFYYTKIEEVKTSYGFMLMETREQVPAYSTDISAAWQIVEQYRLALIPLPDNKWLCGKRSEEHWYMDKDIGLLDGYFEPYEIADTAAHAICLAFLAIEGVEVKE